MAPLARALLLHLRAENQACLLRAEPLEREDGQRESESAALLPRWPDATLTTWVFLITSQYLKEVGFEQHGTVTFPHKTSALMVLERERFYELLPL